MPGICRVEYLHELKEREQSMEFQYNGPIDRRNAIAHLRNFYGQIKHITISPEDSIGIITLRKKITSKSKHYERSSTCN